MLYQIAYSKKYNKKETLNPGESFTENILFDVNERFNYKLRVRGGVGINYLHRTEDAYPRYFRKLEDSLVSLNNEYVLTFNKDNQVYERTAYYMIKDQLEVGELYEFSFKAKAKGVNDNFNVMLEVYYGQKNTRYYHEQPDCTYSIALADSEDFIEYKKQISFEKQVAFVMVKISALGFTGEASVFAPTLACDEKALKLEFEYRPDEFDVQKWIGEGFSLTERPYFTLKVNGKEIFSGNKTDRLQSLTGVEFILPENTLTGNDKIELTYGKVNKIKYEFEEIQLITLAKQTEIMGVQEYQVKGVPFGALCYFDKDCTVDVRADGFKIESGLSVKKGYSVIRLNPIDTGIKTISINDGEVTRTATITVVDKKPDGVITGTGDFIYVNQNFDDFIEYIAWYLSESIGDMITFRSCYRWGGTAEADPVFWKRAIQIVKDLGLYYVLMIDGRELNGVNANPTIDMLQSEYFLGEQTHEKDGSYTYWDQHCSAQEELFFHAFSRKLARNGIYGKFSPVYNKKGQPCRFYAGDDIENVKEAYEQFVHHLSLTNADGATRHTGVTPMFDAFFKAGYKWLGYESMYGNHEIMFSAIRGMSNSVGQDSFGSHMALQWSTVPCDEEGHALRYRLSLYSSYLNGAKHINTEEGLFKIENPIVGHDRFSKACTIHREEQKKFNHFVKSHTRRGKMVRKIAMMVGKYDGMDCFSTGRVYGQYGEFWAYNTPEDSWDLLKTFYPQAKVGQIYLFVKKGGENGLSKEDRDFLKVAPEGYTVSDEKSLGFYSATPYGVIDLIAYDAKNLSDYEFIFLTGWNTCSTAQLEALCKFMDNGGKVMLCKSHLFDSVSREEVLTGKAKIMQGEIVNKFLSYKDNLIYFDRDGFPIEFKEDYALALKQAGEKYGSKLIKDANYVTFTEYARDNGATDVYAVNMRWWNQDCATFNLKLSDFNYGVKLTDNLLKLLTVSPDKKKAVFVENYGLDVIEIDNEKAIVYGFEKGTVKVFIDGNIKEIAVDGNGETVINF